MVRYHGANKLDPHDVSNSYYMSTAMFEKGNYKGCASMCKNAHTATNVHGMNDRQVIMHG